MDYTEAGLPHYWILDLIEPVSMGAHRLTKDAGYAGGDKVTGIFRTAEPFPVTVDLTELL